MSELRTPDPTLDALDADENLYMGGWDARPLVAHLPGCLSVDLAWMEEAQDARWFAVPCRECFPDAPQPGHHPTCSDPCMVTDPYLSWQVRP